MLYSAKESLNNNDNNSCIHVWLSNLLFPSLALLTLHVIKGKTFATRVPRLINYARSNSFIYAAFHNTLLILNTNIRKLNPTTRSLQIVLSVSNKLYLRYFSYARMVHYIVGKQLWVVYRMWEVNKNILQIHTWKKYLICII